MGTDGYGLTLILWLKYLDRIFRVFFLIICQTSEQDEASFERQRREPLAGSGCMPPPPLPPTENQFEIQRLRNVLVSIFRGIFLQKSQSWACVEVHFFIA